LLIHQGGKQLQKTTSVLSGSLEHVVNDRIPESLLVFFLGYNSKEVR
jgi:hypothetical protein